MHSAYLRGSCLERNIIDNDTMDIDMVIVHENDLVKPTILVISKNRLGATAIVNDARQLTGIFTDGDLRRMLEKHSNFDGLRIKEVMTKAPKTIAKGEYAIRALNIMRQYNVSQLIVMDKDEVAGFVHFSDLLNEGIV